MSDKELKVGDKVKIINTCCIESYELNKVGVIERIDSDADGLWVTYKVDMGRPRRPGHEEDIETCWYLQRKHIELVSKPNEQLLFNFMYEE